MLELITKLFSVKPGSMRAWRWRRVLVVVWVFPLFGLIAMWNQIGLALDWARATGSPRAALFEERARTLHGADRDLPLHLEPSGEDFLSPSLGAADLLARVLSPDALAAWLDGALPTLPTEERADWLTPAEVPDRQDGRLAHLDGLNLSRAWMLGRLAAALPAADPRRPALEAAAAVHREAGLAPLLGELPYAGSHWLGTFAAYLLG